MPALVELWNSQAGRRALAQPMTQTLLEECVFAKPYFDRLGLIVAKDDDRLVGFAHAGFAAGADGLRLSTAVGAVNLVLVAEHPQREADRARIAGAVRILPDRPRGPHLVGRLRAARARILSWLVRRQRVARRAGIGRRRSGLVPQRRLRRS